MGFSRDKDGILNSLGNAMRCFAEREWEMDKIDGASEADEQAIGW